MFRPVEISRQNPAAGGDEKRSAGIQRVGVNLPIPTVVHRFQENFQQVAGSVKMVLVFSAERHHIVVIQPGADVNELFIPGKLNGSVPAAFLVETGERVHRGQTPDIIAKAAVDFRRNRGVNSGHFDIVPARREHRTATG
ncbi:hypothetical protein SDC9_166340 [bioreactor metagenome]|uniref:Uncharacterized protein n=1 Tax=bioreactor metagenome TaxID=1076179 RepID=A0A645G4A7_9ZZZZ